jgi:WD40 repeat protein
MTSPRLMFTAMLFGIGIAPLTLQCDMAAEPETKAAPGEVRRLESSGMVLCVAFSPDGRFLVSAGGDYRDGKYLGCVIRLWEASTGKDVGGFEGHESYVHALAFSPDGKKLISGSMDTTMRLWDVATRREISHWRAHTASVNSVAFMFDGKRALSGGQNIESDYGLCLWNVATGKEIRRNVVQGPFVSFSPDGRQALCAETDKSARVWDMDKGMEIRSLSGHERKVMSAAFSRDGKFVLTGCVGQFEETEPVLRETPLYLWRLDSGKEIRRFRGHSSSVRSVVFSPDGKRALSCSGCVQTKDGKKSPADCVIRLWEVESGKEIHAFVGHEGPVYSVAFSPEGKYFISGSVDRTVRLWRLPD